MVVMLIFVFGLAVGIATASTAALPVWYSDTSALNDLSYYWSQNQYGQTRDLTSVNLNVNCYANINLAESFSPTVSSVCLCYSMIIFLNTIPDFMGGFFLFVFICFLSGPERSKFGLALITANKCRMHIWRHSCRLCVLYGDRTSGSIFYRAVFFVFNTTHKYENTHAHTHI